MNIIDIAALAVPPSHDAECAAEVPAGAAEAFAALLDGAAGATGEADEPSPARAKEDATDDQFDELAALAMTSLLSIGVAVPPTPTDDVASSDEVTAGEIADEAARVLAVTDLTSVVVLDVGMSSQLTTTIGNDMGADASDQLSKIVAAVNTPETQGAPKTTRDFALADENPTADAGATPQAVPNGAAAIPLNEAAIADADMKDGVPAASTAKVDADGKPASKTARSSKPSHSEHANAPHKADQLSANAAPVSSLASVGQAIEAARASAPTQQTADVRPSGSMAARFARALERAAAPATSEATTSAPTANANGGGSGQPSGFGDSTPDLAAQLSAASRQSVPNVMAFTVNGPVPIDTRTMATAVAAATGQVDNAPVAIPERDVIAQLVQSLRVQFRDGIGEAVLKLKPEHLGSVQISLRVENGAIKATVQAEAPAVRQWLESQQDTLRTGLAEQGLRLERFVVEPDGERRPTEDAHQQREQEQRRRQHQRRMSEQDHPVFEVTV